jgi:hypothetical protein
MNSHYKNAIAGLEELGRSPAIGEVSAVGAIQVQAALAVAKETAELRKAQDLGNLIAYAQLCKADCDGARYVAAKSLVDEAMAPVPGLQGLEEDSL